MVIKNMLLSTHDYHSLWNPPRLFRDVSIEHHTHSLKDELLINSFDRENALVPVKIRSVLLDQTTDPFREHCLIHIALDPARYTRH